MTCRYFLVYFFLTSSLVPGQSTRYELRGQKVNLKPNIPGLPDSILWKCNGNKVVEFNGQEEEAYGQYENRVSLDWHTAELTITDLRFEDSGDYELEAYVNKQFSTSAHKLEVIDKVARPTISCEMNDGGGSNKSGTLLCSVEPRQPQSLMKVEWQPLGNVQPGPQLTISLGDKYDDEEYSCRVSNPLSEETATFKAKDCYPEDNSVVIGVVVTVIIVLSLLLLGLALGIFFCKRSNKACFANRNGPYPENPTPPDATEEDDNVEDQTPQKGHVEKMKRQLGLSDPGQTLFKPFPGSQSNNKNKGPVSPPTSPCSESPSHLDLSRPACNNKDTDEDQLRESAETKVPHCENTPEPAVALVDTISSTAAEQSESDKESVEDDENRPLLHTTSTLPSHQPPGHGPVKDLEKDEDEEEKSDPVNAVTPVPKPRSQPAKNSPNMAPEVTIGEKQDDANLDQVNGETDTSGVGETNKSGASSEDEQLSPVSEQKDSETTRHDQDPNLSQNDSEDNQQEMDKLVPAAEKESGSGDNSEEADLYSDPSHRPESPTPTKPDDRSTDTVQESPDTESGESEDDTVEDKK